MRNVTIFGNFTVLETFTLNYMNIDKGYDDRLEVFYRLNLYIEDNKNDVVNIFQDYYYRNINDLMDDLHEFIQQNNRRSLDEDMSHLQKLKK
jgi:hypothetical protein